MEKQTSIKEIEQESQETSVCQKKGRGHSWTEEEVATLIEKFKKYKGNWAKIVKHLKGRNISQCSQKYRKLLDQEQRTKKKWSLEEDQALLKGYKEHGKQWHKISLLIPGRSCKQVRDRFINKLDPSLNFSPWTEAEDKEIVYLYSIFGPRWTYISQQLKYRSENAVKNRFYYCLQKDYNGQPHPYLKISGQ
ncbi:hypothetical protein pb186bvf_007373 [Paramecium bursaria]